MSERALVSVALLLVGAGLMLSTFGLQFAELGGAFSPMFFPRIVLMMWVGLALLNVVADVMAQPAPQPIRLATVAAIGLGVLVYVIALPEIGFFFASVPLALGMLWLLEVRSPVALVGIAVGVPGALVVLFNHVLTMPLPASPFLWWI
ncbi:tripartite tricarboxylate transporter TctB family protein [Dinoroseobacter shibae]